MLSQITLVTSIIRYFYFTFPFLIKMVTLFHLNSWWVTELLPMTLSFPAVQNETSLLPITDKMHVPSGIDFSHFALSYTLIFLFLSPFLPVIRFLCLLPVHSFSLLSFIYQFPDS